jgi:hypothetical protein
MPTLSELLLASRLSQIGEVEAVFAERDAEDLLMVFVVVGRHSETIHEQVITAGDDLAETLSHETLEIRVRARQGRPAIQSVPVGSRPVYVR